MISKGEPLVEEEISRHGWWYTVRVLAKQEGLDLPENYRIVCYKTSDPSDMDYLNVASLHAKKKGPELFGR